MSSPAAASRLAMTVTLESWPLRQAFRITGHLFTETPVVVVTLSDRCCTGRGEAAGVYYNRDTPARAAAQLEAVRAAIEDGIDRERLSHLLPPGAARNAADCALWDLEAQVTGRPVWELAGLEKPHSLVTTFTIGADTPAAMAAAALAYEGARAIKLKLIGDGEDGARVAAVRAGRPDVTLAVDANQGFSRETLQALWPAMLECEVVLVEQPHPVGQDALLDGVTRPIPVAADESVQCLADLETLAGRYDMVNIKLDKCGGLTEALAMARRARALGLGVMVGNMMGTSLAMAPSFVLGQVCDFVDLDGPFLLARDRSPGVSYGDGCVSIAQPFWGGVS